jgi:hypothetical protein
VESAESTTISADEESRMPTCPDVVGKSYKKWAWLRVRLVVGWEQQATQL